MKKTEEAFKYIVAKFHHAQLTGQGELVLHAGTIQEELGWKGLQRVVSGNLARICAYFYCAGHSYSFTPVGFPTFTRKAENIYGSNLKICFRFPNDKNILPIFQTPPSDIIMATITKELQNARLLYELEHQPYGSDKWVEVADIAKARGLLIPEKG